MELDKRITIGRTYLDCFDTDIAMQFLNEKCYFGGKVTDFADISKLHCSMLYSVDNSEAPYEYYKEGYLQCAEFILPCKWVKEPKKDYRPYTLEEFIKQCSLGDEIIVRRKDDRDRILHKLFTEFHEPNGDIYLGNCSYNLKYLYEEYELYTGKGWKPFGIEE